MNCLDEEQMAPQTFLYGCVLESGKDVMFSPDEDDYEHQLDLRMACVDTNTKDELHTIEVEGQDLEGQKVKAVLVSLKPSTLPSVCLGGFTITPPAVFRLKAGSGPVHISGQHLVMMGAQDSFDEDDSDEDVEDEEEEEVLSKASKKRPASSPVQKTQKKLKMDLDEDDDDDDDDEDDDEDDEDDDDDEEESEAEESPVKAKQAPSKAKKAAQNGKGAKGSAPAPKEGNTPKGKGDKPKSPPTPKAALTIPEIKAKMLESVKKGVTLPKIQPKFENLLKNGYRVSDAKVVAEMWKWRQTVQEAK
ncbi:nucleophosmin 1a [Genypterus blacodes]|uniref:nucleophosmin 1a n=1 Tax=Genypterus blacodes TaxID=154954 RepID=UPI003F76C748